METNNGCVRSNRKDVRSKLSYRNYEESISAKNKTWKSDARKLLEQGKEFIVIDLKQEDFRDCKALAQEFDYDGLHEDPAVRDQYPKTLPSKHGFVKRNRPKNSHI